MCAFSPEVPPGGRDQYLQFTKVDGKIVPTGRCIYGGPFVYEATNDATEDTFQAVGRSPG